MHSSANAVSSVISLIGLFGLALLFDHMWRETRILDNEHESFEQLRAWRLANPTVGVADCGFARGLVQKRIAAYNKFSRAFVLDPQTRIAHLSHLYALLEEHSTSPPSKEEL